MLNLCSPLNAADDVDFKECPYHEGAEDRCGASLSRMPLSRANRGQVCTTENFDDCPLFLSRIIRKKY